VLETGCVYIVPLMEASRCPADIAASANPKSSTGRLDVFTRVIADRARGFDRSRPATAGRSISRFPAHLPGAGAHRLAPVADPLPPRRGALDDAALAALHARERWSPADADADVDGIAVDRSPGSVPAARRLPRQAPHRRHRRRPARRATTWRLLGADARGWPTS
jgi:dCTP deaminase